MCLLYTSWIMFIQIKNAINVRSFQGIANVNLLLYMPAYELTGIVRYLPT